MGAILNANQAVHVDVCEHTSMTEKVNKIKLQQSPAHALISGYIRTIGLHICINIPEEIVDLLFQFYLSKTGLFLVLITHDQDPNLQTKEAYESPTKDGKIVSASIKVLNTQSHSIQNIHLLDKNNNSACFQVDPYKCFGHCFIPKVNHIPSNLHYLQMNINQCCLLYRFTFTKIECIAFMTNPYQTAQGTYHTNAYLTTTTNCLNQRYYPMTYNYKRNSIFYIEGADSASLWGSYGTSIYEYDLNTNKTATFKSKMKSQRAVRADICLINDEHLFISGGRNMICMADSLCPCRINSSVELFDIGNKCNTSLCGMNVSREGHGSIFIKESTKVVVGGGQTDYRRQPKAEAGRSIEIYDFHKNEWLLVPNKCSFRYRRAKVFYKDNPNVISIVGFDKYDGGRCEMIDIRDNQQRWQKHDVYALLKMEKHIMHIV
eukprot:829397_1